MLTNASLSNKECKLIVKKAFTQSSFKTLVSLLNILKSKEQKYQLMTVLIDILTIDVSLAFYEGKVCELKQQVFSQDLANFLYNWIYDQIVQNNLRIIRPAIVLLSKLQISKELEQRLQQMSTFQPLDQLITLMICNCGGELKLFQMGD